MIIKCLKNQLHDYIPISKHVEGDWLLGVVSRDAEKGFIVPVETGGRILYCRTVEELKSFDPVMIVCGEM